MERIQNKVLRREDLKSFWPGFQEFRHGNVHLEQEAAEKIRDSYKEKYWVELSPEKVEKGAETITLFFYGVKLARDIQPGLVKDVPVPRYLINTDEDISFSSEAVLDDWYIVDSYFGMGLNHIVNPEYSHFSHVLLFKDEIKTVSQHLPDWTVVDIVIAGAEEYAHELFRRTRSRDKLKRSYHVRERLWLEAKMTSRYLSADTEYIMYHTSDPERRAMVWQNRILSKYFPHWSEPFQKFTTKVVDRRAKYIKLQNKP